MKKLLFIIFYVLYCTTCFSAPITYNVKNNVWYGSGAGEKEQGPPLIYDSFESGVYSSNWTFELEQQSSISIIDDTTRKKVSEMNIYSHGASNFSWIKEVGSVQTLYVFYKIKKNFTWSTSGDDAWGLVKCNRFVNGSGDVPNCYYEFDQNTSLKRVIEYGTSGTGYFTWDITNTFTSNVWHTLETIYKITADTTGIMRFDFDGNIILNETNLNFDCTTMYGFGIGLARVRSGNLLSTDRYWLDDVYIDKTQARVFISKNSDGTGNREIQIPTSWSDTYITITVNQGSFIDGELVYLFVIDSDGNASAGYPVIISGGVLSPPSIQASNLTATNVTFGG